MGGEEAVKKLQPKTLRRGPRDEQRLGAKLGVSKGHRMGEVVLDNFLHTHKDLRVSGWHLAYLRFQQLMALPN